MIKNTAVIKSEYDGLGLSVLWLTPKAEVKGILQISHGMSENKERYLPFMEYIADQGYISIIHDHRGHGQSVNSKADLGYLYGGKNKAMVEDLHQITIWAKTMFPGFPLYLLGHSMGTLVARCYLKTYDNEVDKVILTGPPCKNPAADAGLLIARAEKRLKGEKHQSAILSALSFGSFAKKFVLEKSRFAWICSDKAVVQEYEESDMCGFTFTTDGYEGLLLFMKETYNRAGWRLGNPKLPVLFLGGAEDPCIGNSRKFVQEMQFMKQVGYRNITGKLYPDMRHEILNESGKRRVFENICSYLNK